MAGGYKVKICSNEKSMHYSVGAIIRNEEGKYLLVDRRKEPLGFASLAGHVDMYESELEALIREIKEESGLNVKGVPRKLLEQKIDWNNCSRGDYSHYWYLYEAQVEGNIIYNELETKSIGWYDLNKIPKDKFEPVWKYWFEKLDLI